MQAFIKFWFFGLCRDDIVHEGLIYCYVLFQRNNFQTWQYTNMCNIIMKTNESKL